MILIFSNKYSVESTNSQLNSAPAWCGLSARHVRALDDVSEEAEEAAVRGRLPLELPRPAASRHRHRDFALGNTRYLLLGCAISSLLCYL